MALCSVDILHHRDNAEPWYAPAELALQPMPRLDQVASGEERRERDSALRAILSLVLCKPLWFFEDLVRSEDHPCFCAFA